MAVSVYNFFVSTVGQEGRKGMKIRRFLQKIGLWRVGVERALENISK